MRHDGAPAEAGTSTCRGDRSRGSPKERLEASKARYAKRRTARVLELLREAIENLAGRASKWIGLGLTAGLAYVTTFVTPLGRELMPPLQEGDLVDMPVTVPGVSAAQAMDDLKARNALIRTFPEVEVVVGKAGRAETVTDPAPMEMVETLINLRPRERWPRRHADDGAVDMAIQAARAAARSRGLLPERADGDAGVGHSDDDLRTRVRVRFDAEMRALCPAAGPTAAANTGLDRDLAAAAPTALARSAMVALLEGHQLIGTRNGTPSLGDAQEMEKATASTLGASLSLRRKTQDDLVRELDALLRVPGWANIWTQPIVNRIDMMATGIRTAVGVKVFGPDFETTTQVAKQVASVLRTVPGAADVVVDQTVGPGALIVLADRDRAAAYGIAIADVTGVLDAAVGGRVASTLRVGREEIPIRVRYARDFREDGRALRRLPVQRVSGPATTTATRRAASGSSSHRHRQRVESSASADSAAAHTPGEFVPLSSLATLCRGEGPAMIRGENGFPCAYVQLNVRGRDLVGFVEEARESVRARAQLPIGVHIEWGGRYEHYVRVRNRLLLLVPVVLLTLGGLLWWTHRTFVEVLLVLGALPGAIAGGLLLQALWGADFSVALWLGYIACAGMALENAMIMIVYIRANITRCGGIAAIQSVDALREAVLAGAVQRQRPKLLTEATTVLSLAPMLWATGTGADVTSVMALPVLGGVLLADEIVDLLLPVAFLWTLNKTR